ncbi:MAG TPA: galactose-1-phosphate uridylyltransferase [Candidatus Cryosericum sp.]|nr:galactose-1-phosphate uridylyltransferase [Candidatus Cryosericum sp.]HPS69352.1 galactose-1-phosphate uridylyltransferase [Candidatus Cryosericum sp.]
MSELRKDPITGRWVIITTDRPLRPGDLAAERQQPPADLSTCPFEPGNERYTPPEITALRDAGTRPNEPGWWVRVVPNRSPALKVEGQIDKRAEGMYDVMNGIGAHEIVIETPNHAEELAAMPESRIRDVLWTWHDRILDLAHDGRFRFVMVFKNKGARAGAMLAHPHSQIMALPVVPFHVQEELAGALDYYRYRDRCVFCDLIAQELADRRRVIEDSDHFVTVVPFAQRFPFETWILPKGHESDYGRLTSTDAGELSRVLKRTLQRLSQALDDPPYNLVLHTAPVNLDPVPSYHWHFEIFPRIAHTGGFERGTGFYINPTIPEETAQYLRDIKL